MYLTIKISAYQKIIKSLLKHYTFERSGWHRKNDKVRLFSDYISTNRKIKIIPNIIYEPL